jgi:hypothetical protein
MIYRLSTMRVTLMLTAPAIAGAAWLAWPTRSYEEWTLGLAALTFGSIALMTARYEMEVADGKVELRSVLSSRSLQLKDVRQVTLYGFRGKKVIGLLTDSELLYVPTYMPGVAALVEAIQAANPTVSIDSRIMRHLQT